MMKRTIEIKVSEPYVKVAGGYTGMRPVGRRRTYTAVIDDVTIKNESKSEIKTVIRHKIYPEKPDFVFIEE